MPYIVFYVNDVFFRSQINVKLKGLDVKLVFTDHVESNLVDAALVVFDMSTDFFLPHLQTICSNPAINTLAFLPHIEKDRALLIKELGCKRIVSRKEFSENMRGITTEAIDLIGT